MGHNAGIIGPSFTGKTRSLDTLPPKSVIFSFDPHGYSALRNPSNLLLPGEFKAEKFEEKQCLVIDYAAGQRQVSTGVDRTSRVSDSASIYQNFVRDINNVLACPDVASLAIDGLTGMSNVILEAVMCLNKRQKSNTQADYGDAIEKIVEIVSVCAASSKNFVLICHIQLEKDELSGRLKENPLVYGKALPGRLLAILDNVFQSHFSGDQFYWLTKPTPLMQAIGSRIADNLPEKLEQNFINLFDR